MSNRTILILVLVAAAVLAGVLYYFYRPDTRFNWSDSTPRKAYSESYQEPYGSYIFHQILENYFPENDFISIEEDLPKVLEKGRGNYVFIGEGMFLDSLSVERLLEFVSRGNTALVISKTIPQEIMNRVFAENCDQKIWEDYEVIVLDSAVTFSLQAPPRTEYPEYVFYYARKNKPVFYRWNFIRDQYLCAGSPIRPLGFLNDSLVNFAAYPFRKGTFLLHTAPIAFSNFHLLRSEARAYSEAVLSYLPEGPIYWDACSRVPEKLAADRNPRLRDIPDEHPLTYILQQPALAWAWYLLVGLAGVYLIFRAKRRQRVIPVLPRNENSSYEFISTIANLHFREKNYRGICVETMKLFIAQVRERYGLLLSMDTATQLPRTDTDYFKRLAQVSEVPEAQIRDIFTQYSHCVNYEPTEQMMVDLHLAIERFSKAAK